MGMNAMWQRCTGGIARWDRGDGRTKSDVWDSDHVAHSTTFSNNHVAKFADV